jgi:ATP-binding cassette subfamily B multidrug efflux pump
MNTEKTASPSPSPADLSPEALEKQRDQRRVARARAAREAEEKAEYERDLGSARDYRYLFPSLREYKKYAIITPLFVILEALDEMFIPTLMANLIDEGVSAKNMGKIWFWGAILIGLAIVALACGFGSAWSASVASAGFAKNLRHDLFEKVQSFSFTNIDHFSAGSIITRLTTDVTNVQNAFQMMMIVVFRAPLMVIISWILTYRLNRSISFVFLIIMPLMFIVLMIIAMHVHPIFIRVFHTYDALNVDVEEDLNGMRVVKSFTREDYQDRRFKRVSQRIYDLYTKAEHRLAWNNPVVNFFMYAALLIMFWMASTAIVQSGNNPLHGMTTGDMTSLFAYAAQMLMSMMMITMIFVLIVISRASASRMAAVLREKNTMRFAGLQTEITSVPDGSVEFDHVTFRYDTSGTGSPVLDNVSLKIPSGSTVGIIGGTGSAKSSLVQLIPRLYDTEIGKVRVGGHNVRDYRISALRTDVAMVLQKNTLFEGTIASNLRWGDPNATDEQILHAAQQAQADEFIQRMPDKYNSHVEQGGANFSGGQKQRLCIARALLRKPKILILDDSTSAVDTKTDALIRHALATELPNTTKIIIAQRLSSVQNADQIFLLNNGQIVAHGTHDELMKTSKEYRATYESQNQNRREAKKAKLQAEREDALNASADSSQEAQN